LGPVKIVTDSSVHLRPGVAARLDVTIVPQSVHLGGVTYREGLEISSKEFLKRMAATPDLPKVSSPAWT